MIVRVEQEEKCISSELQQCSAAAVSGVEHLAEHPAEDLREFLCADPAASCQFLGQGRETGDVDEEQCPVDLSPSGFRIAPLPGQPGGKTPVWAGHHV